MSGYVMKKVQRGFAMLEVLLAVIVIAMVSFGVYQLYNSSSESSQAANFQQIASQVMSAGAKYGATTFRAPEQIDLINGGYLPAKIVNGQDILGPYGPLFLASTGGGPQDFQVTADNVPSSQGDAICNALNGSYDVTNAGAQLADDLCANGNWAASGNTFQIQIFSPKGSVNMPAQ